MFVSQSIRFLFFLFGHSRTLSIANENSASYKVVMYVIFVFQCWDLHQKVQRKISAFHILKLSWGYQGEYWLAGWSCPEAWFSQWRVPLFTHILCCCWGSKSACRVWQVVKKGLSVNMNVLQACRHRSLIAKSSLSSAWLSFWEVIRELTQALYVAPPTGTLFNSLHKAVHVKLFCVKYYSRSTV